MIHERCSYKRRQGKSPEFTVNIVFSFWNNAKIASLSDAPLLRPRRA